MRLSAPALLAAVVALTLHTSVSLGDSQPSDTHHSNANKLNKRAAGCGIQLGTVFDDSQGNIGTAWTGAWTHLTNLVQGPRYLAHSFSYTSQSNAQVQLSDPFSAGETQLANVTVWSSKKNDRGQFSIYIGSDLLGTGDQYSSTSQETDSQVVFQIKNVLVSGGSYFVIKNDKGARFMGFDALQLDFCNS